MFACLLDKLAYYALFGYHRYMAFNQRKEKEIAMARMTYTALQWQIRVLTINTDCWEAARGGCGHKSKNTNRGGIAYQAKSSYGRPVFEVCHSLQVYNTVHGTIAAVGEDLCQAKEGGISKGNGSNRDHGGSRHNNPGCQSPLNLLFHNGRTETTNE